MSYLGRRRVCLATMLLAWTTAFGAHAEDMHSGNFWLARCSEQVTTACLSFLHGAQEMHERMASDDYKRRLFCPPDGITLGQSRLIVVKYLRENPNLLHLPFVSLVTLGLAKSFPCPRNPN